MVQLTYYPSRETSEGTQAWQPAPDDVHTLRYGYNLADLDRLARIAMSRSIGQILDPHLRYELAWSGIVDFLYSAETPPEPVDLIGAGHREILTHLRYLRHDRGIDSRDPHKGSKRFAAYWEWAARRVPSHEDKVVDRTALWQIWPLLTDGQRRVLAALAACGTYQEAARSLGLTTGGFVSSVVAARRAFLKLWHEGETPSRVWGVDRRVATGDKPKAERRSVTRTVARRSGKPRRTPQHGKTSTYNLHGCRCVECTAAVARQALKSRIRRRLREQRPLSRTQIEFLQARHAAGESIEDIARDMRVDVSLISDLLSPDPDKERAA